MREREKESESERRNTNSIMKARRTCERLALFFPSRWWGLFLMARLELLSAWGIPPPPPVVGVMRISTQLQQHYTFCSPLRSAAGIAAMEGGDSSIDSTPTSRATPQALSSFSSRRPVFLTPLLDFTRNTTIDLIDRLDDVIMGGISTSTVVWRNDSTYSQPYAQWFGVCREDGGGFCGWRTNPFRQALPIDSDVGGGGGGLYVTARLSSDNDTNRRVWKLSTRTRPDRGEQLYQATVPLAESHPDDEGWVTALIPFDNFQLVRGPKTVANAPPLNVSTGLYQIGMTMSKFVLGNVTRELDNFRSGYFALDLKVIGVYSFTQRPPLANVSATTDIERDVPAALPFQNDGTTILAASQVLTKTESERRRPWLVQHVVVPLFQLMFFSEQSQRRKSAFRMLTTQRGLSSWQAVVWGWNRRQQQSQRGGRCSALRTTANIMLADMIRFASLVMLRVTLVYPLKLVSAPFRCWFRHRALSNGDSTANGIDTEP